MNQEKMRVTEEIEGAKPSRGFWSDAWQRYRRRPIGMLALGFVLFLTIVAIFRARNCRDKTSDMQLQGRPSIFHVLDTSIAVGSLQYLRKINFVEHIQEPEAERS